MPAAFVSGAGLSALGSRTADSGTERSAGVIVSGVSSSWRFSSLLFSPASFWRPSWLVFSWGPSWALFSQLSFLRLSWRLSSWLRACGRRLLLQREQARAHGPVPRLRSRLRPRRLPACRFLLLPLPLLLPESLRAIRRRLRRRRTHPFRRRVRRGFRRKRSLLLLAGGLRVRAVAPRSGAAHEKKKRLRFR